MSYLLQDFRFNPPTWERYIAAALPGRLFAMDGVGEYYQLNEDYQRRLRNRPAPAPHAAHIGIIMADRKIAEVLPDLPIFGGALDRYAVGAGRLMILEPQPVMTPEQVAQGILRITAYAVRKTAAGTLGYDWESLRSEGRVDESGKDICSEFAIKYLYAAWGDELFTRATGWDFLDGRLWLPDDFFGFCKVMFEG